MKDTKHQGVKPQGIKPQAKTDRRRIYLSKWIWNLLDRDSEKNSTSPSIEIEKTLEEKYKDER